MTSDLIDQHFKVSDHRFVSGDYWIAEMLGNRGYYLRKNGDIRYGPGTSNPPETDGWFATYADLEAAYQLWLKRQKEIAR